MRLQYCITSAACLVFLVAGCERDHGVKLERSHTDVIARLRPYLPSSDGSMPAFLTNQLICAWDLKREKNGLYCYVENREENWRALTNIFRQAYQTEPRVHSKAGTPEESIFYGVGVIRAITGLQRSCREHEGESTNSFCIIISPVP